MFCCFSDAMQCWQNENMIGLLFDTGGVAGYDYYSGGL